MILSTVRGLNPVTLLREQLQIIHCCDAGFDMDDFGALMLANDSGRLAAVLTSLYRPDEKKSIVTAFLNVYQKSPLAIRSVESRINQLIPSIFAGEGYYPDSTVSPEENKDRFLSLYPRWPTAIFGDPSVSFQDPTYQCIYPYQAKPFIDNGILLDTLSGHSELENFIAFLDELKNPVIYVSTGPTTNLARLLRQRPNLIKTKIKTIVMMNGTFANPPRMGYNGGLNLQDTKTVFDSGIPCLIVPSALCANYVFPKELVDQMTAQKEGLSTFGKLFHDIMLSWETHRARKKNPNIDPTKLTLASPILADPLTMLLALHPELIGSTRNVNYTFDLTSADKHLLHKEAATLTNVEEEPGSNVFEVTSIVSPEEALNILIKKLNVQ
jgi:hypothetical protein